MVRFVLYLLVLQDTHGTICLIFVGSAGYTWYDLSYIFSSAG